MKKFNLKNENCHYYNANILDIWCQENKIVAYVQGTYIYRTEMIIKNDEICNYYCNCPSSEGGMSFCKHLSGVAQYLKENEILEMESIPTKEEQIDLNLSLNEISLRFRSAIYNLVDPNYDRINFYNSSKYLETIIKYTKYIDNLLEKDKPDEVFKLVIQFLNIATNVNVDCEDEYSEGINEIIYYIEKLIKKYDYKNSIINYISENYKENEISTVGVNLIYVLINSALTKEDAKNIINLITSIRKDEYYSDDLILEMINLTYKYIGLNEAIKLANKYRNIYGVKRKIIYYMEELNDKDKLIKELKKQIKEINNSDLYEKLLSIYLKDDIEKARNLLLVMVNKFYRIEYYKELKSICNKTKMNVLRKEILNNLSKNNYHNIFLLEIYKEDNMIKELFLQIKKYNDLDLLSKYKKEINSAYHTELLDYYKKLIIGKSKTCYGRSEYYGLCRYIKDLYQLDCSSDYIIEMLRSMYPYYKTKKAFKEEILRVLNLDDKKKFEIVVHDLDESNKSKVC